MVNLKTNLSYLYLFKAENIPCLCSMKNSLRDLLRINRNIKILENMAILLYIIFWVDIKAKNIAKQALHTVNVVYSVRVAQVVTETMLLVQCLPNI